jgi:hypothetical protein
VVDAPPFQGIVDLPGAVGGEDHDRRIVRFDRPDLGNRDLEVGEQLEEECLELLVGPVELVDQQYRHDARRGAASIAWSRGRAMRKSRLMMSREVAIGTSTSGLDETDLHHLRA